MSSGMNTEQAKEYAKTMTYSEAVSNVRYSKGIKYRKATMIKLRELAEIADRLDKTAVFITGTQIGDPQPLPNSTTTWASSSDEPQTDCETCRHYKLACELFSEVCKYEPITQTEIQNLNNYIPQTEEYDRIPFDPFVEMDIKRAVEERLKQTDVQE